MTVDIDAYEKIALYDDASGARLEKMVCELVAEVRRLRESRTQMSEYSPKGLKAASHDDLVEELLTQECDRRLLRSEIRRLKDDDIAFLTKQRDFLSAEVADLRDRLDKSAQEVVRRGETIAQYQRSCESFAADIAAARAEVEAMRKQCEIWMRKRDRAYEERDAATAEVERMRPVVDRAIAWRRTVGAVGPLSDAINAYESALAGEKEGGHG